MKKYIKYFLFLVVGLLTWSCLESPSIGFVENNNSQFTSEAICYIDMQGFFRTNNGTPKIVEPIYIYYSPNDYQVLDIRNEADFIAGHIEGAINVLLPSIIEFLTTYDNQENKTLVITCNDGSLSSYVNCLLGIYGFDNTYVLKFGMAGWNPDFASGWSSNLRSLGSLSDIKLNGVAYHWGERTGLPFVPDVQGDSIPERVKNRIKNLLSSNILYDGEFTDDARLFCTFDELTPHYNNETETYSNLSVICYDDKQIYFLYSTKSPDKPAHPVETNSIELPAQTDYRLDNSVQRIPKDETIVVYSRSGHRSAYLLAVLRILGFNAKSMLYGVHSFSYEGLTNRPADLPNLNDTRDVFLRGIYGSLPYIIGE